MKYCTMLFVTALVAFALAGCGGGGGNSQASSAGIRQLHSGDSFTYSIVVEDSEQPSNNYTDTEVWTFIAQDGVFINTSPHITCMDFAKYLPDGSLEIHGKNPDRTMEEEPLLLFPNPMSAGSSIIPSTADEVCMIEPVSGPIPVTVSAGTFSAYKCSFQSSVPEDSGGESDTIYFTPSLGIPVKVVVELQGTIVTFELQSYILANE